MEGRRVTRKNQKYNPLFILFLCLVAAVIVLLIVSIVLGARLNSANKKLKSAEAQIQDLTETVVQLNDDLSAAKSGKNDEPVTPKPDEPAIPGYDDPVTPSPSGNSGSWLDLTGHNEVKVKPTDLLDGFATYYTTAGVNLRSGPGTSYDRITTIDYGEQVQVAAQQDNWSFVKVDGKFGWINSDYLSTKAPQTQSRTESTSGSIRR